MKTVLHLLLLILILGVCVESLQAGNTGKIVGKVTDRESGSGIPGVTVIVVGTQRGGATDPDGNYTIIGVPIGTYTVKATCVGYSPSTAEGVRIGADETIRLDFKITTKEVQLGEMTITANRNIVNSMTTGTVDNIGQKAIESVPAVKTVDDVVKLTAGVVKQGENIFVRGGRANEVQYVVDGVSTNGILSGSSLATTDQINQQTKDIRSGNGVVGGGGSLQISTNAIQSISVQTSGFDADQGNAQSGIINIVTKSGGDKYTGSTSYRSDRLSSENQNETYGAFSFGGPEPITKYILPGLGVKIPGNISFFISGDASQSDGRSRYVHNDFYNPMTRRIQMNGFLGGLLNGFGFNYADKQRNLFTFNGKVTYAISSGDQVFYRYSASLSSNHGFNINYKYRADSSGLSSGESLNHTLQWQHFFGQNSFLRVNIGLLESKTDNNVAGMSPYGYSSVYADASGYGLDLNADGFTDVSNNQNWSRADTRVWSTKIGYEGQVHPLHLLKVGMEYYYEEINSTQIVDPTSRTPKDETMNYNIGLYPGLGDFRSSINSFPSRGGFYVQDNIEFSGLNLHAGLRYDYFDIGRQVFYYDWDSSWRMSYYAAARYQGGWDAVSKIQSPWMQALGYETKTDANGNPYKASRGLDDWTRFMYYLTHGNFSPRLSIGYPITDRIVFYFNYGHFYQYPERDYYFKDSYVPKGGVTLGNPSLNPQRTISYEAGFQDQFNEDMAFGLHAFYKDVFDYTTTRGVGNVVFVNNFDYASSRGFEITYNQALSGNFQSQVSYSYQIAKGRTSNPQQSIFDTVYNSPREVPLDWDQSHTLNLLASYRVGPNEEGHLFGLPFVNNYGISLSWQFGSGFPYNGYNFRGLAPYTANSETAPYTSSVDLSIYKGFTVLSSLNVMATLDVLNLFDRMNPTASNMNPLTGRIIQYGDVNTNGSSYNPKVPSQGYLYDWHTTEHDLLPPDRFSAPRQILLGLRVNWE